MFKGSVQTALVVIGRLSLGIGLIVHIAVGVTSGINWPGMSIEFDLGFNLLVVNIIQFFFQKSMPSFLLLQGLVKSILQQNRCVFEQPESYL